MSRLTVRGRVTLASLLVLALGLGVLTTVINVLLTRQLDSSASSALHQRAEAERATVVHQHGRTELADAPHDEALDERAWVYVHGKAIARPPERRQVQRAADALAGAGRPTERTVGESVRLLAEPVYAPGNRRRLGTIVVGISLQPYKDTEHAALIATLLLDAFVLVFGALVARRAVGKALRPVADMTAAAAEWTEHDLEKRFGLGPPRDELTALSATLDAMLARIASSLRHEQRFSAEMAHELRTPLSGVRAEAELALGDPTLSAGARAALEEVLRGTDRMEAVIETLLGVVRRGAALTPGAADARQAAATAVQAARTTAARAGVDVRLAGPDERLRAGADGDVVAQTLQPLLDNAVRHARASVRVSVGRTGDAVAFVVEDDGGGLDGEDAARLFEPGVSTEGGAGLGLPLARRLARACGGDVVAVPESDGGRFELRLPAVA